jgi:glyoxylase I family protein
VFDLIRRRAFFTKVFGGALASAAAVKTAAAADAPAAASVTITNLAICVTDLEKSTKFYADTFGFKPAPKPVKVGAALAGLLEAPGLDLSIQFIPTGGVQLELFQFASPKATGDGKRRPMNQLGITHFQVKVADVKGTLEKIAANGGTVLENTRLGSAEKMQAIFALDPDGTRMEIVP